MQIPSDISSLLPARQASDCGLLLSALALHDRATAEHCVRVAQIALHLAEASELVADAGPLVAAALLHDIGKLACDPCALAWPGPLLRDEWRDQLRRHPSTGAALLEEIESLRELAAVVRHHHERWDGKGYPDGLAGGAIPRNARIIAVADTADCIKVGRPYSAPGGNVLFELESSRGQFDPALVEAWRRMA